MPSEASTSANTAKPPSRSTVKRRGEVERSTICCRVRKSLPARLGAIGAERGAERRGHLAGRQARADDEVGPGQVVALTRRHVHLVAGWLLQRQVPDVADDADHAAVLVAAGPGDVLPNRVLAGPEGVGQALVDQHHRLGVGHVARRQVAPGEERHTHRRGIALADHSHERQRDTCRARRSRPWPPRPRCDCVRAAARP